MTHPEEQRAQELLAKITPGDWDFYRADSRGLDFDPRGSVESWREDGPHGRLSTRIADYVFPHNAEFIAAAPQIIRDLLALLARERSEKEQVQEELHDRTLEWSAAADDLSQLHSAIREVVEDTNGRIVRLHLAADTYGVGGLSDFAKAGYRSSARELEAFKDRLSSLLPSQVENPMRGLTKEQR